MATEDLCFVFYEKCRKMEIDLEELYILYMHFIKESNRDSLSTREKSRFQRRIESTREKLQCLKEPISILAKIVQPVLSLIDADIYLWEKEEKNLSSPININISLRGFDKKCKEIEKDLKQLSVSYNCLIKKDIYGDPLAEGILQGIKGPILRMARIVDPTLSKTDDKDPLNIFSKKCEKMEKDLEEFFNSYSCLIEKKDNEDLFSTGATLQLQSLKGLVLKMARIMEPVLSKIDEYIFAYEENKKNPLLKIIVNPSLHGADIRYGDGSSLELKTSIVNKKYPARCNINWIVSDIETMKEKIKGRGSRIQMRSKQMNEVLAEYNLSEQFLIEYFERVKKNSKRVKKKSESVKHNMGCDVCKNCHMKKIYKYHRIERMELYSNYMAKNKCDLNDKQWADVFSKISSDCGGNVISIKT